MTSTVLNTCPGAPLLLVLGGSRAYGYAREDSDYDYRGVYLRTPEEILTARPYGTVHPETTDADVVWYSIEKYLDLAKNGSPEILEMLYAPNVLVSDPAWERLMSPLIADRAFLTKRAVACAFCGAAYNSYQRSLNEDLSFMARAKNATNALRLLMMAEEMLLGAGLIVDRRKTRSERFAELVALRENGPSEDWPQYLGEYDTRVRALLQHSPLPQTCEVDVDDLKYRFNYYAVTKEFIDDE